MGSLGEDALGGASIGITYFNLMFYFLLGVSSALDTLGAQAYGADDVDGVISWSAPGFHAPNHAPFTPNG